MKELSTENLNYIADSWIGDIPVNFPFSCTDNLRVTIRSIKKVITEEQKLIFSEFCKKYSSLWPSIAEILVSLNPKLENKENILTDLKTTLLVYIPGITSKKRYDIMLGYELKSNSHNIEGTFIGINNWIIELVINAD